MNTRQILSRSITTTEHSNPATTRYYIRDDGGFCGYSSVYVEDDTWDALCEIACERGCTVDELCCHIGLNGAPAEDFTPASRRYVLRYIEQIPDNIELPANFRVLTELLDRQRAQ